MADLRITELDFEQIKENLKNYLRSQDEFVDYDFEGSGLNVLMDVLAYNTHYNAMLTHLMANEMFLDTAIKRSSVVSIAKTLGYTPRSATASRAQVNLTFVSDLENLYIGRNTKFNTSVNGNVYTFTVNEDIEGEKSGNVFTFNNVMLYEGIRVLNSFTVRSDTVNGPFVIQNENIDINTLTVEVFENSTSLTSDAYQYASTIVDIRGDTKAFWVEENFDGKYQIVFGDNIIGKQLEVGNVVTITYLACNGNLPNGATEFSFANTVQDATLVNIELVSRAASGAFREGIDEIRFNAPKFNATRNRAVTAEDYKALITSKFSRAKSVSVWGGEENIPPIYGKVFITIEPKDGEVITEADKDFIEEQILRPVGVVSIQREFVDPDYIYVGFEVDISYDPKTTSLTNGEIAAQVANEIEVYFNENLRTLQRTFVFSQFIDYIQSQFPTTINGVLAKMRLQRRFELLPEVFHTFTARFLTSLNPETVRSTNFATRITDVDYNAYLQDFSDTTIVDYNGTGTLKLLEVDTNKVLSENVGTVNYRTGVVTINNLYITQFFGEATELRINATPQELGKNISPDVIPVTEASEFAVVAYPSKNTIIDLDDSDSDVANNLSAGLIVRARPLIQK